eukprot:GFUD01018009.1.p1 GENE.GFUD01018009.1~~GFUD01018009.1.p1  ORF type:complete len:580 (-),score=159.68 GFUD01018009.1:202-1941(-)
MPKGVDIESDPSARRKSTRAKKMMNHSLLDDLPEDIVNSVMKGAKNEVEMPPGFNPSDDSEDEYMPMAKKGRKKNDSDFDSEEEIKPKKARRGRKPKYGYGSSQSSPKPNTPRPNSVPTYQATTPVIKPEPGQEETLVCLMCPETLKVDTNARFHYSVHYYDANAFISLLKPEDLKDGKAQDEIGRVHKYTCPHEGCTRRKMGYKEMCVHLATAHQQLRQLMMEDTRPGIKEVLARLYPQEIFSAVKVKQEKGAPVPYAQSAPEVDNSEDVDDPTEAKVEAPKVLKVAPMFKAAPPKVILVIPKPEVKTEGTSLGPRVDKIHNCLICNGPGKSNKDGRKLNLGSGLQELKYHYSVCVYNEGGLVPFIDPGQGSLKSEELEEYGAKFRYKCPFPNCSKNQGRNKAIGYKEYAIHCGVAHHQIEKWMVANMRPGLEEVYAAVKIAREEESMEMVDMPEVVVEEMHTCFICEGKEREGRNLSFDGSMVYQTRYHYASCYYDEGAYLHKYPPGAQNTNEEGGPKDILGKEVKYSCQERNCTVKRKLGYKEFTIHMSNEHGGLEKVMKDDHREAIRNLAGRIQK